ncbi:G-type lectin S-receptor-like serine/threonine-protein kinase [Pyrus ussuriensis x Pyrus communis]|uniref:G-type lectin S-receptor-like serine/threonine-protein kinase n=1 Tax=Pyrus ussuriensis x Pyrus communis TaxID=2448454 RepID=A0A5N5HN40_9ROSA|nr:G-type lectin S-receptor-like serine/threonine-protein kinase [Pyrus ussuriensis x Pyrus communis]
MAIPAKYYKEKIFKNKKSLNPNHSSDDVAIDLTPELQQQHVKVLTNTGDKIVEDQFMAEVGTLRRTYHMNLVKLYGFCFDHEMRALVYEYMENGSLDKFLFSEHREIGLEKLHNITPGNVLLDKNLNPKVADFELAKLCNRGSSQMLLTKGRGTPGYAAPEMWKPYPVTHKCHVYSFGMLLFEVLPRWIWNMFDNNELEEVLLFCGIEEQDKEKAERMIMVALLCIQHAPEARPLMSNEVQMLEGHKEIASPPSPFQHLQSPQGNLTQHSGTDEDLSSSASATKTSAQCEHPCDTAVQNKCEIELATF